jgi:glutamyl-tRNA synthetase
MKNIVTRIAPSPTGPFAHIGNVRTLLYNYFLAKKSGGKFYVRLEDTDRDRYTDSFLTYFKDMCDWLGIVPDGSYWNPDPAIGSFTQSTRDYSDKVKFLLDNGMAYYAFDSKDDLDLAHKTIPNFKYDATTRMSMKNSLTMSKSDFDAAVATGNYVIRFAVTPDIDITINDAILGDITINTNTLDDKVLIKSNGIGSYHLCNVCDDHDMGVTHVLRGNEWVNSTPFHVILYKAFGWDVPTFAHLPLIMNPDGKGKLSKRTAMKYGIPIAPLGYTDDKGVYTPGWKDLGYDPKAFMNYLALIGWNPGNDVEVMSMDDMINLFSLDRVHKSGARFDMDKAKWINAHYLRATPNSCLKPFINPLLCITTF